MSGTLIIKQVKGSEIRVSGTHISNVTKALRYIGQRWEQGDIDPTSIEYYEGDVKQFTMEIHTP